MSLPTANKNIHFSRLKLVMSDGHVAEEIVYSIFALYRDTERIYVRYDDLADNLHYIQLQFGVEPSEDSWRSKRDIFS